MTDCALHPLREQRLEESDHMYLVQLLLPIRNDRGEPFSSANYGEIRRELTERYGGVTAHLRAPALGLWKDDADSVRQDDMITLEVVIEEWDRSWWADYRSRLERRFCQEQIHGRVTEIALI